MNVKSTTHCPEPAAIAVKDVRVDVTGKGWNPVSWSQEIKSAGHGSSGTIKFPHGKDNYDIIFNLINNTGHKIRFDASKPVFVERDRPGSPCPSSFNTDQMLVESCDGDKLVIRNWNVEKMNLHYQLNFVTDKGNPVNPFDPIIQNDGGGVKSFS